MITVIKNKTICETEISLQELPNSFETALHFWSFNSDKFRPLTVKERSSSFDLSIRFNTDNYTQVYKFKKI
jgi:hypothetical protein